MAEEKQRPMTLEDWERIQQGKRAAEEARMEALLSFKVEDRSNWPVLYPLARDEVLFDRSTLGGDPEPKYIALALYDIPFMVQAYISMVETERTNRLCKCEWIIHPDDKEKPEGSRRIHKGQESPHCPVHTKFGFLLYFFDHYFHSKCPTCPPDCRECTFNEECQCVAHAVVSVQLTLPEGDPDGTQDAMAKIAGLDDISGTFQGKLTSKCTLGNIATVDCKRVCCGVLWPGEHTPGCREEFCEDHGN
jgi:hypothetical protein